MQILIPLDEYKTIAEELHMFILLQEDSVVSILLDGDTMLVTTKVLINNLDGKLNAASVQLKRLAILQKLNSLGVIPKEVKF